MTRLRLSKVLAEIRPDPTQTADVVVDRTTVTVTLSAPRLRLDETQVLVTESSVRLQAKEPEPLHLLIPLPVSVRPGRYVLRVAHGVLDFQLERPSD